MLSDERLAEIRATGDLYAEVQPLHTIELLLSHIDALTAENRKLERVKAALRDALIGAYEVEDANSGTPPRQIEPAAISVDALIAAAEQEGQG